MEQQQIKQEVKKKYGALAATQAAGCGDPCCADTNLPLMADRYDELDGYVPEADLALGCGIPTQVAQISVGDTVVDLGAGAGNDAFVARRLVGETGKVIGLDMTPEMIQRAEANTAKLGFQNVEFVLGDIERMDPIPTDTADVVISNCVMNLVPDKVRAFAEVYRILKPGGHFSISDIVYRGELPSELI
ncbi:MAG: methyltransferase domain-containing protein [Bacteroidota bacterium]